MSKPPKPGAWKIIEPRLKASLVLGGFGSKRVWIASRPFVANLRCVPVKPLNEIVPVLQVAIGPVILISGVGLLLLTMTNRLGRAIDRARSLVRELREGRDHDRE